VEDKTPGAVPRRLGHPRIKAGGNLGRQAEAANNILDCFDPCGELVKGAFLIGT
jgi:hypothetical protein